VIINLIYDTAGLKCATKLQGWMQAAADMLDAHFLDSITVKH